MSEEKKFLIPVPGRLVLDPSTHQELKAEGEWKPWNTAWARKITFGDVVEGAKLTEADEQITKPAADEAQVESEHTTKRNRKGNREI